MERNNRTGKQEPGRTRAKATNFMHPSCGEGADPLRSPYPGYPCVNYKYYPTYNFVAHYAYPEALELIVESVRGERED